MGQNRVSEVKSTLGIITVVLKENKSDSKNFFSVLDYGA